MVEQHDINALNKRVTDEAKESVERDHIIERRQERTTAHLEQLAEAQKLQNTKVDNNGNGIEELKQMHAEVLRETKYVCKTVDETLEVAKAARTIAEDVKIGTDPVVLDFNQRARRKKSWRSVYYKVAGGVILAGVLGFLAWLIPHIVTFLQGGGT